VERHECDIGLGGSGNRKCCGKRKYVGFAGYDHHLSLHRNGKQRQCNHRSDGVRERRATESHADTNPASTQPHANADSASADPDADTTSAYANTGRGFCERYYLAYG
jgi:hypothetical protein